MNADVALAQSVSIVAHVADLPPSLPANAEQWTELVLSDTIVRVEYTGFSWTAGARKHRVSRSQVHHVVAQAELYFIRPAAPPEQPDEALLFLGDDQEGARLEVVGVELADGRLRVIHAMAMRTGYKGLYEEAKTWRE